MKMRCTPSWPRARRSGAWILADEIYRGAELAGEAPTPTLLGSLRASGRDRRSLQGLRAAGPAHRLGGGAARPHPEGLGAPRLHDPHPGNAVRSAGRRRPRAEPARRDPGPHPRHRAAAMATPRRLAAAARSDLRVGAAGRRRHRPRSLPPPPRLGRPRGAGPSRAVGAARARRHDGSRTQPSFRLRLRHRAHARGARAGSTKTLAALAVRKPTAAAAGRRRGSR